MEKMKKCPVADGNTDENKTTGESKTYTNRTIRHFYNKRKEELFCGWH